MSDTTYIDTKNYDITAKEIGGKDEHRLNGSSVLHSSFA